MLGHGQNVDSSDAGEMVEYANRAAALGQMGASQVQLQTFSMEDGDLEYERRGSPNDEVDADYR